MTQEQVHARRSAIADILRDNPNMSHIQLAYQFGVDEATIRRDRRAIAHDDEENHISEIIAKVRTKDLVSDLKAENKRLASSLAAKDAELQRLLSLGSKPVSSEITPSQTVSREVVPVIVASDWHIEEKVSADITNNLNEYNIKIAEDSARQFFSKACEEVLRTKKEYAVSTVVLALLGDFINGVLREEDLESNQVSSVDAINIVRSLIYSGIRMLARNTKCNIRVVCCVGNHGRLTKKIHYSNQVHDSLEYLMYKTLEQDFADVPEVEFIVAEGPYKILKIFDVRVRFHHGHMAKYNGGIGGLALPVMRKAAQLNMIEEADLDVIGHFHSLQYFNNVIVNGSLVGSNAYSMSLGMPHDIPKQVYFLIDSKYGRSEIKPIFIDRVVNKLKNDMF